MVAVNLIHRLVIKIKPSSSSRMGRNKEFTSMHVFCYTTPDRSTMRRRLDSLLDSFDDKDLIIMEATADGISKAKDAKED